MIGSEVVAMLTKEENRVIALTGPGTPCGALMRRYWHPVALCEELPPSSSPRAAKILGEELALFRHIIRTRGRDRNDRAPLSPQQAEPVSTGLPLGNGLWPITLANIQMP